MKKFIALLALSLCFGLIPVFAVQDNENPPIDEDIKIEIAEIKGTPLPRPRTEMDIIAASLTMNQLTVNFYAQLGEVEIYVTDTMGQAVAASVINTNIEGCAIVTLPFEMEGQYTVEIYGETFTGYGYFVI